MNGVLLRFLWRRHRISTILIGLVPLLIGVIIGFIFPTFDKVREAATALIKAFPAIMRLFGNQDLDIMSPAGSFSLCYQDGPVLIAYAILPAIAPLALYAGDRGRGALDLLLATRLDRGAMGRTVLVFQLMQSAFIALMAWLGVVVAALLAGEVEATDFGEFWSMTLAALGVTACFGGIAMLIAVRSADGAGATRSFGIVVFLSMAVDIVAKTWMDGEWLGWFTPLGYMRPARLLSGKAVGLEFLAYLVVPVIVGFVLTGIAIASHRRRATA